MLAGRPCPSSWPSLCHPRPVSVHGWKDGGRAVGSAAGQRGALCAEHRLLSSSQNGKVRFCTGLGLGSRGFSPAHHQPSFFPLLPMEKRFLRGYLHPTAHLEMWSCSVCSRVGLYSPSLEAAAVALQGTQVHEVKSRTGTWNSRVLPRTTRSSLCWFSSAEAVKQDLWRCSSASPPRAARGWGRALLWQLLQANSG